MKPPLAAIALGLLLVVLGHDALMAADPHDAGHGADHVSQDDQMATACGPTEGVQAPTMDGPGPVAPAAAMLLPLPILDAAVIALDAWAEPSHPPDVRRALLQVFLN